MATVNAIPDAPFVRGRNAAREGEPITANPYPEEPPRDGDAYPGPYHNWRAGWLHAKATDMHSVQMKRKVDALALMEDGRERTKAEIFYRVGEIDRNNWRDLCRMFSVSRASREMFYQMKARKSAGA